MGLTDGFNDRQAIMAIKNSLQTNLEDPLEQYSSSDRNWIHTDEPMSRATFPRIQVRKRGATYTKKISLCEDFIEWRALVLDIQFWTKTGFKWKDTDNLWYQDEELVKEWLDKAWVCLKAQQNTLKASFGITGLLPINEEDAYLEPDSQLFTGTISLRLWYFRR